MLCIHHGDLVVAPVEPPHGGRQRRAAATLRRAVRGSPPLEGIRYGDVEWLADALDVGSPPSVDLHSSRRAASLAAAGLARSLAGTHDAPPVLRQLVRELHLRMHRDDPIRMELVAALATLWGHREEDRQEAFVFLRALETSAAASLLFGITPLRLGARHRLLENLRENPAVRASVLALDHEPSAARLLAAAAGLVGHRAFDGASGST